MAVYQSLTLTQVSQDVLANKSQVRILWQSQQTGQSYNGYTRTAKYWVCVNGGEETEHSVTYTLPQYTNKTILDTTVEVPHDALGSAAVTVRTHMETGISAGTVELTKTLELTPIARASTLVASDAFIGAAATIVVDRKSETYTHSIGYQLGDISGYIASAVGATSETEVRLTATSIGFPVPETFYAQIPNAPSGTCLLTCCTYSGDTLIGEPQTAYFTVTARESACCPLVEGSVEDCNGDTLALTGDAGTLINGFSTARCTVSAQARNAATVKEITVNGTPMEDSTDIPNVETGTFTFVATDSRGYPGTAEKTLPLIPYFPVSGVLTGQRKGPTSWEADITVKGKWFSGSFGTVENALTVMYRIGSGDYVESAFEITTDGDSYTASVTVPELDYTKNITVEVIVSDKLSSAVSTVLIKKGIPVYNWKEDSFTFNVPVSFKGGIAEGLSQVYPVGSVYMSVNETSPAELFGGIWERLKDVFLLAAGDTYAPGASGGEAAHTLTVEEMPSHSHVVPGRVNGAAGDGDGAWDYSGNWPKEASGASVAAGGGAAHNNMPPYLAVYVWKRTE